MGRGAGEGVNGKTVGQIFLQRGGAIVGRRRPKKGLFFFPRAIPLIFSFLVPALSSTRQVGDCNVQDRNYTMACRMFGPLLGALGVNETREE